MYGTLSKIVIAGDVDQEKAYLLHAHLASLLDGIDPGHVDGETFAEVTRAFSDALRDVGLLDISGVSTGNPMRAEILWNAFSRAVAATADKPHPRSGVPIALADTRDPNADYRSTRLVTLSQIEWQDAAVRAGARASGRTHLASVRPPDIARQASRRDRMPKSSNAFPKDLASLARKAAFSKAVRRRSSGSRPLMGIWRTSWRGRTPMASSKPRSTSSGISSVSGWRMATRTVRWQPSISRAPRA